VRGDRDLDLPRHDQADVAETGRGLNTSILRQLSLLTLTLRDKSGRPLTRRTSATPAAITMKAPYTGLFFAAVSSAGPGLPGYTLSVRKAR
jgi:hypothetical protein